jgi:hypothetical protein
MRSKIMPSETGHPSQLRWANPDAASTDGEREIIIGIMNLVGEVSRIADLLDIMISRMER